MEGRRLIPDPYDFSLVLGGPLYLLLSRARLSGAALELVVRRVIVISLFAWLPLLILSMLDGHAWGDAVRVPFLRDIEVHARFLLALPLLIAAELTVHQRTRLVAQKFLERDLIPVKSRARFDLAIASAVRLRNSVVAEVTMLALVYLVGILYVWPGYVALNVSTWYVMPTGGARHLFMAGWWFVCVSLPIFQFILVRWYFRLFVWARFLWHVTRCDLSLVPTHPDGAGGLGFLSSTVIAFAPVLLAHGVMLAGPIANRIFFHAASLADFKVELAAVLSFVLVVVLAPLLSFTPHLFVVRRVGLLEYGTLAQRYVREFDNKWLRGRPPADEALVGSADIQSLADLANSFELVRRMRFVPFTRNDVLQLAAVTLLPVAPLLLTMLSWEDIVVRLLNVLF